MKIYIVRHGVTAWNAAKKVQGVADIPLAEEGVRLARLTGEALKEVSFDVCYTSPLSRARQTAELILGDRGIPVIEDERIREISFGILEGGQVGSDPYVSSQIETFFGDPDHFERPQGGENIADICGRTADFWREITTDPALEDKTVLIVTHGCATRALLQNVYESGTPFWHGHVPPNCAVNIVEVCGGRTRLLAEDQVCGR